MWEESCLTFLQFQGNDLCLYSDSVGRDLRVLGEGKMYAPFLRMRGQVSDLIVQKKSRCYNSARMTSFLKYLEVRVLIF